MQPENAAIEFVELMLQRGLDRASLTVEQGVSAMLAFYRDVRADGCSFESDADMLLYQWGTYDWGRGEFFELNVTRQLIHDGSGEDEDIWQLGLTFKFTPTGPLRGLRHGNRWCSNPDELEEFEKFIRASEAFQALAAAAPAAHDLRYECAGQVGPAHAMRRTRGADFIAHPIAGTRCV
jgi:hypothetical protein